MSKRTTTGLPDKGKATSSQPVAPKSRFEILWDKLLGNPKNRQERENGLNRLIVTTVAVSAIILAVLIAISVFVEQVVQPSQAVATVNGEALTVREFRDRVRLEQVSISQQLNSTAQQLQQFGMDANEYFQSQEPYKTYINELNFPDQLGQRVLNDMVKDKLAAQQAATLGITVSDEQIQEKVNSFFSYDPTQVALTGAEPTATVTTTITPTPFVSPTPTPLPTNTPEPTATIVAETTAEVTAEATAEVTVEATLELPTLTPEPTLSIEQQQEQFQTNIADYNRSIRQQSGVGQDVIDASFRREALQEAIGTYLLGEGNTTTYVRLRHILVATEEEALDVVAALNGGESFADLAAAVSTDTGSAASGGIYDWAPALNYVPEFKDASLTLEIGTISAPVKTEFGYHVMQVIGREDREVVEADLAGVKQSLYTNWITQLEKDNQANIVINDTWVNYVPSLN